MASFPHFLICFFGVYALINSHLVLSDGPLFIKVCARTTFADYCRIRFQTQPSSFHADLHQLGDIALDLAIADASTARGRAQQLINQTKDAALVEKLGTCKTGYRTVLVQMQDAKKMWAVNNFAAVRRVAFANFDAVFACRDALGPKEALMYRNNKDVENMSHIILVICNY
ncbi:hypothetical protein QQ045_006548 [Rhodiola kirilowii]